MSKQEWERQDAYCDDHDLRRRDTAVPHWNLSDLEIELTENQKDIHQFRSMYFGLYNRLKKKIKILVINHIALWLITN